MSALTRRPSLFQRARSDDGMSLVLVVGMVGIISLMAITTAKVATDSLESSRQHVSFEGSLATAEAGVDAVLADIKAANAANPGAEYVTSGTCAVTAPTAADLASNEAERVWARNAILAVAAAQPSCVKRTADGDYVSVRPAGKRAVYSMGWYPEYSATAARRLIKAEYIFSPFAPSNAVLTEGNLDFSGSVAITALVSSTQADVHTNSSITGYNNSLQVSGSVSSSGTLPGPCPAAVDGGCTASAALQEIPNYSAREYYVSEAADNYDTWFDLCPGGEVRYPSTASPGVPCTGTLRGTAPYNAWHFNAGSGLTPDRWTLKNNGGGPYPGTYYVFEGDAQIGDNGNSTTNWPITVIAEAKTTGVVNPATCNKLGGNVEWKLFRLTPKLPGLQIHADANLTGSANADAGSGVFYAVDRVSISTSSSTITGAVIAGNGCAAAGPNIIQGVSIVFDDTLELSVSDVIRTALWLEYPAG